MAREDLSLARIAEGHADGRAILAELGRRELAGPRSLLGVWAAEPGALRAVRTTTGWRLSGAKRWCSGSHGLDLALVTASAADGSRLFAIDPKATEVEAGSWEPIGMARTASHRLLFDDVELPDGAAIGGPDAYVRRPGFGHGGCGVAACWWGGAVGVVDGLHRAVANGAATDAASALGHAVADLTATGHALRATAAAIDERPGDLELSVRLAAELRLSVEGAARRALDRTVAALGAAGLCQDPVHSGRVADLTVYLSQLPRARAEADLGHRAAATALEIPW